MYPQSKWNIPTNIPARKAGFIETILDAKRQNPQYSLGIFCIHWMLSDVLKLLTGGERGIRTLDRAFGPITV